MLNICADCFPSPRESTNNFKSLFVWRKNLKHYLIVFNIFFFFVVFESSLKNKFLIFTISEIDIFFFHADRPAVMWIDFLSSNSASIRVLITLCEKESQISKMLLGGKLFRLVTICNLYLKGQFEVKLTTTKGLEDQKLKRLAYFSENAVRD